MNAAPILMGIMSGTSCDGVDVAVAEMGATPRLVHLSEQPMPDALREPLLRLCAPAMNELDIMGEIGQALGRAYAEAARRAAREAGLELADILAIGLHGQTIRHRPDARHPYTLQIGSAAQVAERTGLTVVSDFRARDIAAGGCGAPLVPFAHRQLFAREGRNVAVLNVGGIANITWLGADGETIGFDAGPGNMVMDGLMLALTDGRCRFDANGELAARGQACPALVEALMADPWLARRPPKSAGREQFGAPVVDRILGWPELSDADRLATALAFTVCAVRDARRFLPGEPDAWLVCGGGARNARLMQGLAEALAPAPVQATDEAGVPSQAVEALAFAILAWHALLGAPNTLAAVTGAARDTCGGAITPGDNWPRVLETIRHWTR